MKFKIPLVDFTELDIEINQSEKVVFIGANGSGKSRLGEFINKIVYQKTTTGIDQLKNQISIKTQELNIINTKIENLISNISNIKTSPDSLIFQIGQQYKNGLIQIGNGEVKSRIDILNLVFERKINVGNIKFSGNEYINDELRSLEDIDGGTISFGGLIIDVDLMKVDEFNSNSLIGARKYISSQYIAALNIEQEKKIIIENELETIEKDLGSSQEYFFNFSHRISAHRSLVINESSQFSSFKDAISKLLYGSTHQFNGNLSKK